ncbi:hypothetical protein B0H66DRAFT_601782 [Apodospora peruviana]|uniref:Uncharacterized protein n=1 Tax=Apodospora peruviana TaxID=516989 RepID=A0AAE0ICQ6_9PEZI|nr:hypothetical protein B0H66DRAFT_601782 [Apodospora peruviana]
MAIPRVLPAVLGTIATLATTAVLVVHIILAQSISNPSSAVRITAIIAATLEAVVLIAICPLCCSYLGSWAKLASLRRFTGLWFGAGLLLCTVAAAVSVSSIICLNNASAGLPNTILGSSTMGFLVGSSVALGFAFATQLIFLVFHFILGRLHDHGKGVGLDREDDRSRSAQQHRVKSIPYHQTSSRAMKIRGSESIESRSPPGSSAGRSATETMSSIRSSLSHVVRPISSKTRLLSGSQRSHRRPASLDSNTLREPPTLTVDGFDSWDTSAVDPQNRQTVLETSSPPLIGRFLETIPASPTTSRSPSPGTPLDLEAPRTRRRSRSYSPASVNTIQAQRTAFTQQASQSESHIHPLFRSDSPTPPSIITPGTVVTAAPNAGRVISDRHSVRSLARMRSGSLPAVPSPLSTKGSFDSFHRRVDSTSPELREEDEVVTEGEERKMTPPIPDWILSAGSRTSLTGYNSRKIRIPEGGGEVSPA